MHPSFPLASRFRSPERPEPERAACNFDLIGRYFHNASAEDPGLQVIDAATAADLDLDAVFERIDRTTSCVGRQWLYARMRTLRGAEDAAAFGLRTERFAGDEALAARCSRHLARLADDDAYDLQNLIFDTPVRVRRIGLVYALTAAAAGSLLCAACVHPLFLLLFALVFAANGYIHFSNKLNIALCASAVRQLNRALRTACELAAEHVPGSDEAAEAIRGVAEVRRRSRIVGSDSAGGSDLLAIAWFFMELVKIAFNIEVLLYHRFIGSIVARRDAIHALFRFVGATDAALAVARLRDETPTCRPEFVDGKYLEVRDAVHPLIDGCTSNTLTLDGAGLLLTGSNMSGKTTFIRTLMLNALLAETLDFCMASVWRAPYLRLHSSIRIADDIAEGTSYYLQEVLTVKGFIEAAADREPCLFALDELFKGTNTVERIAAGKAVLAHLNRGPHLVLVSTHDIELAELLRDDAYELHHFREEVVDGRLVFDYRLHTGPLATRNAIRILELYDYPAGIIAEACEVQERLTRDRR